MKTIRLNREEIWKGWIAVVLLIAVSARMSAQTDAVVVPADAPPNESKEIPGSKKAVACQVVRCGTFQPIREAQP